MLLVLNRIATAINITGFDKLYPIPNKLHPGIWTLVMEYRDDKGEKCKHEILLQNVTDVKNVSDDIIKQVKFLLDLQTTEAIEEAIRKAGTNG